MRLNNTRVSFTINEMDFLVDGDRRYLPIENGYLIYIANCGHRCFALFAPNGLQQAPW
jgi:hypothetical protein